CVSRYVADREIHAFPTRRSSDLVAEEQRDQQRADVCAVDVGVGHEDDLAVAALLEVEAAPAACAENLDDRGALDVLEHVGHGGLDRKSTRLNSSHVKISYAVFCL